VPIGVELKVLTVKVEDPDGPTELGEKLAVAPEGNPVTLKLTLPVNPLDGVTLTLKLVSFPRDKVWEDGVVAIEKAFTASFTGVE
jgi:hypothetical protein